jgi:hypothetical protein
VGDQLVLSARGEIAANLEAREELGEGGSAARRKGTSSD